MSSGESAYERQRKEAVRFLLRNGKNAKTVWLLWRHGHEGINASAHGLSIWEVCNRKRPHKNSVRLLRGIRKHNATLRSLRRQRQTFLTSSQIWEARVLGLSA